MNQVKKRLSVILLAAVIASLAACAPAAETPSRPTASPPNSTSPDASASVTQYDGIKLSHHPYIHALPTIYMEQNGTLSQMFTKYSIDLYANGPVQNEAIASGSWEAGTTGTGGAVLGSSGYNLKTIGFSNTDTYTVGIWIRGDSPLASLEPDEKGVRGTADDWRGKDILCATGTTCHMALIVTLEHLGLTPNDVNIIDTSVPNCYTAFLAGQGDIACLWEPYSFQMESDGGVCVAGAEGLGLNLPNCIVVTEEAIATNRDAVYAWFKAYLDTEEVIYQDEDNAVQMLYDFQNSEGITISLEDCQKTFERKLCTSIQDNVSFFTPRADGSTQAQDILLDYADFMISQGKLNAADRDKMVENGMVDTSFMMQYAQEKGLAAN